MPLHLLYVMETSHQYRILLKAASPNVNSICKYERNSWCCFHEMHLIDLILIQVDNSHRQ